MVQTFEVLDYFRVTGANDSVENYADLFTTVLRNDDIQEFDSKWDEISFSMTKIPSDDVLEGLYKLRIRESEKLKNVSDLYNLEIHQKKAKGQCSKGDTCSFRHDVNKRSKPTQPNPSPRSSTRQDDRNALRTRSPRGRCPSGRMSQLPCKDYLKGTCTN